MLFSKFDESNVISFSLLLLFTDKLFIFESNESNLFVISFIFEYTINKKINIKNITYNHQFDHHVFLNELLFLINHFEFVQLNFYLFDFL